MSLANGAPTPYPQYSTFACVVCKRRKRKCSMELPECRSCTRYAALLHLIQRLLNSPNTNSVADSSANTSKPSFSFRNPLPSLDKQQAACISFSPLRKSTSPACRPTEDTTASGRPSAAPAFLPRRVLPRQLLFPMSPRPNSLTGHPLDETPPGLCPRTPLDCEALF